MGKIKVSRSSAIISKDERKQLNSLIKVLKPKVYITDSSSFKRLVQELTGNGNTISSSPPLPSTPQTVNHIEQHGDQESSMEASLDASVDSVKFCNQVSIFEVVNQSCSPPAPCLDETSSDHFLMNQEEDVVACQDFESLLLDIEQHPFYSCFSQIHQEEAVSIYDYDLSGIF